MAEVPSAIVCTEPEAAAIRHAGADAQREGALVGVYDLGGGTFDAAVLRATRTGAFALAGPPEGIEHMGGIDFDEAIYAFTVEALGHDAPDLARSDDPDVVAALARVRRRCVTAKEALSVDHVAEVAIDLPGLTRAVRITRGEFESMVRSALDDTIRAFERAIRNAGTSAADLASVVLVGGSVRIPLVFESISRRLDCQVIMPRNPSHSVALGAAMAAERYRPAVGVPRGSARAARPAGGSSPTVASVVGGRLRSGQTRPTRARRRSTPLLGTRPSPFESCCTCRPIGGRSSSAGWSEPGQPIGLGRPLAEVELRPGSGGSASATTVALRSPFDGVVHRTFVAEGAELRADDLLVGYRQVSAFLDRSGRTQTIDVGVRIAVPAPMSATAEAGRPVVFVDRVPRGIWWSATFCLLTEPGQHLIGVGYTRGNSWFGVATCEVTRRRSGSRRRRLHRSRPGRHSSAGAGHPTGGGSVRPIGRARAVSAAGRPAGPRTTHSSPRVRGPRASPFPFFFTALSKGKLKSRRSSPLQSFDRLLSHPLDVDDRPPRFVRQSFLRRGRYGPKSSRRARSRN